MRVVAGTARGRRLLAPEGETTRPTSDRVREAVFNALHSQGLVQDARMADLFAGSGAMGIEALSRGAEHVWFVERDRFAADVIVENLDALGFRDRATVVRDDVVRALTAGITGNLDVVVADPPYGFDGWLGLFDLAASHLAPDGLVVAESGAAVSLPAGWEKVRERTYGGTVITFAEPPGGLPKDDRSGASA